MIPGTHFFDNAMLFFSNHKPLWGRELQRVTVRDARHTFGADSGAAATQAALSLSEYRARRRRFVAGDLHR